MNILKETTIGAIVAANYRTASIFEKAGIDFCCNGNRTIEAACRDREIEPTSLLKQLQMATDETVGKDTAHNFNSWPLDLLADYVEKKHHRYVATQIPVIQSFLEKIVQVHGAAHPELAEIKNHFYACGGELTSHMKKEESILFPNIRSMAQAVHNGSKRVAAPFGTVQNPIRMMMHEHNIEGERFRRIRELTHQYVAPADGCATYKAAFAALHAFEDDLHMHIHLENNILFPRSIEMEEQLAQQCS